MGNAYCCCYSSKKKEIIIRGELSLDSQVNSENSNHYSNNYRIINLNNNHINIYNNHVNNNNNYANNNINHVNNNNNHANRLIRLKRLNRVLGNNLTTQTIADGIGGLGSTLINALGNKEKNKNLEKRDAETKDGKNNREYNSKEYNELNTHEEICLKDKDDVSTQLLKPIKSISINNLEHNIINENSNDEKKLSWQLINQYEQSEINHYSKNNQYEQHEINNLYWRLDLDLYNQSKKEEYNQFKIDSYDPFKKEETLFYNLLNHDLIVSKAIDPYRNLDIYENNINENLYINNNEISPEPVNEDPIIPDF